ncbi:beta-glucosidase [Gorillibacterium massiliense]|uniref:beta-glucosidase n=1 Tax=Gorillibacterium massiliense TaxID=1280390 RepID=UPI0004B9A744|nr:glycoside hydrolase family 3 C-terminal domain-containing protein [Gorillibacterium massiliense]
MKRDLKKLISEMTLEEKAAMCSGKDFWRMQGVERLGIPSLMVTDGPHGLRKQVAGTDHIGILNSVPATCFPSAAGLASSWDRELIEKVGQALGEECQAEDVAVLLGPGANIKRSPLCGRNFEYFSEDPYLSSEMAAHHILGVQSQGVGTSIKHFAANNQEHRRMTSDSVVDERTLREIYLASFEGAIKKAQPWTVMCSYNKLNGAFMSENPSMLTDILKDEWGHEGFVVSDWGAVNERAEGLAAGLELEMPSSGAIGEGKILEAVRSGKLSEEKLDQAIERLLHIIFKAVDSKKHGATYDPDVHHDIARVVARESMVLLKNEDSILPLKKEGKIAVIGELAQLPRYQGGGSSHVVPTKLDDICEEMAKSAGDGVTLLYAQGYSLDDDMVNELFMKEALKHACEADVAVLFVGLPERYESEGYDRTHLHLPDNQLKLIDEVAKVQPNVVVILSNGSPVEMPWIGDVKAVLEAYLGGQAMGGAIADLLFGDANPCGKLAETFPKRLEDNPSYLYYFGEDDRVEYREGIFVGYRYYDTKKVEPLFPFGHGLSYTTFDYSDIVITQKDIRDDESVDVRLKVMNSGQRAGKEIVQLYVRDKESKVIRPEKELKGFMKVELQPGEEKTVTFTLNKRAFAYYNVELKDWHVESGVFDILIGSSSNCIVLSDSIQVQSTTNLKIKYNRNTTVGDLLSDPVTNPIITGMLSRQNPLAKSETASAEESQMMAAIMKYLPLRALLAFSGGTMTEKNIDDMLTVLNGGTVQ